MALSTGRGNGMRRRGWGTGSFSSWQDGRASVEHHAGILLEDISTYGTQTQLTDAEKLVLEESLMGLHYVWSMRVHENIKNLDSDLCERMRSALLLFMNQTTLKGPKFISRAIPTRFAAMSVAVFCGMTQDVQEFLEAVNANMTETDLRRALNVQLWLNVTEIDDADIPNEGETMQWTYVKFNLNELRRQIVRCVLYLADILESCSDWQALVHESAHATFERFIADQTDLKTWDDSKMLLAPKGQYWDTAPEVVLKMFRTKLDVGLSLTEVEARRLVYGGNIRPAMPSASLLLILFRQLSDLIVVILIVAAIISGALGNIDTCVILGFVIIVNTAIGSYQEVKAQKAISALASLSTPQCTVVRDSERINIDATELVPGDIVILEEGNSVPADLRMCQVSQLAIIETLLTGESVPVEKFAERIRGYRRIGVGDRKNLAFQSTVVSKGRGTGVVVNTGVTTEIGKISSAISSTTVSQTPLQKKLARLGTQLVVLALIACAVIVGIGLAWNPTDLGIIKVGVSLALSVIPEGLVAIVTLTMALGMKRMAKQHAIVRNLPAVETLGSITTICSDKTGTITEGQMRTRLIWTKDLLAAFKELSDSTSPSKPSPRLGVCYMPKGSTAMDGLSATQTSGIEVVHGEHLNILTQWSIAIMSLCNNASLQVDDKGDLAGLGDQTEVALAMTAHTVDVSWPSVALKRKHEFAFDSDRKRMTVVCEVAAIDTVPLELKLPATGGIVYLSKGAPEVLLELCSHFMDVDGQVHTMELLTLQEIDSWCEAFSHQGLRTLALAMKMDESSSSAEDISHLTEEEAEGSLIFVGIVALSDPPRKGIESSIAACHAAGIRVCMITGDHLKTATAIAQSIGMLPPTAHDDMTARSLVMNGPALSSMTIEHLAALEPFPVVFSRVSPENKLNIVKALQLRGDITAMTGDGVNDAPAIRQADVGVAMGKSGTDITREAADIVLQDDNFATIVSAVQEGRKIFDNITKFIVYLLSCNLSEVILLLVCVAAGLKAPLTAIQILYANIVVDIPPSLALGAEDVEINAMQRPPRNPVKSILGKRVTCALLVQATSMAAWTILSYALALTVEGRDSTYAESVAFLVLFITQTVHAFWSRSIRDSIFSIGLVEVFFGNKVLFAGCFISIVAVICGLYIPGLNTVLELQPVDGIAWAKVVAAMALHLAVVEVGKYLMHRVDLQKRIKLEQSHGEGEGKVHGEKEDQL